MAVAAETASQRWGGVPLNDGLTLSRNERWITLSSDEKSLHSIHRFIISDTDTIGIQIAKLPQLKVCVIIRVDADSIACRHGIEVDDEILAPLLTSGVAAEYTEIYDLFQEAGKQRPSLAFEVLRNHKERKHKSLFLDGRIHCRHRFIITEKGDLGISLENHNSMARLKSVAQDSLGEGFGLRTNDVLFRIGALDAPVDFEKCVDQINSGERPMIIEVWRAICTTTGSTRPTSSINIPGTEKCDNPFLLAFQQVDPAEAVNSTQPSNEMSDMIDDGRKRDPMEVDAETASQRGGGVPLNGGVGGSPAAHGGSSLFEDEAEFVDRFRPLTETATLTQEDLVNAENDGGEAFTQVAAPPRRGKKRKPDIVESRKEVEGRGKRRVTKKKLKAEDNAHLGVADRAIGKKEKDDKEAGGGKSGENDLVKVSVLIKGASGKKERRIASVKDLFTEGRSTITLVDEGITYSCGPPKQTRFNKRTIQYDKVYKCCMVHNKKKNKWESDPKHRDKANSDVIGCEGRIRGYFRRHTYWFTTKHCHTCDRGRRGSAARVSAKDHRPKIQMLSPAPMWDISREKKRRMTQILEKCPDGWWEPLPGQGNGRRWLKGINEIGKWNSGGVKQQIEAMMRPYLDFVKNQYPCMRYWRVGALETKPLTPSQYEKMKNQLHSDYSETALKREAGERPMSMIMALDDFNFLYEDKDDDDDDDNVDEDDLCCITVRSGHAIAFTNELFHAGGENMTNKTIYRLFAYIVSDEKDYPNSKVFTKNRSNMNKLNAARENIEGCKILAETTM